GPQLLPAAAPSYAPHLPCRGAAFCARVRCSRGAGPRPTVIRGRQVVYPIPGRVQLIAEADEIVAGRVGSPRAERFPLQALFLGQAGRTPSPEQPPHTQVGEGAYAPLYLGLGMAGFPSGCQRGGAVPP